MELRVDGGAAANDLLMQFQADLLGVPVVRPKVLETTALGAAYLAGLTVDLWKSRDELAAHWKAERALRAADGCCGTATENVALARGRRALAELGPRLRGGDAFRRLAARRVQQPVGRRAALRLQLFLGRLGLLVRGLVVRRADGNRVAGGKGFLHAVIDDFVGRRLGGEARSSTASLALVFEPTGFFLRCLACQACEQLSCRLFGLDPGRPDYALPARIVLSHQARKFLGAGGRGRLADAVDALEHLGRGHRAQHRVAEALHHARAAWRRARRCRTTRSRSTARVARLPARSARRAARGCAWCPSRRARAACRSSRAARSRSGWRTSASPGRRAGR